MKKKIMAVTLCLAMVSTFAVGCGQKNETDSGKSEEKSSGKVEIEFVQVKREAAESYDIFIPERCTRVVCHTAILDSKARSVGKLCVYV